MSLCGLAGDVWEWFRSSATTMHLRFTEEELATLVEMISLAAEVASLNRKPGAENSEREKRYTRPVIAA